MDTGQPQQVTGYFDSGNNTSSLWLHKTNLNLIPELLSFLLAAKYEER